MTQDEIIDMARKAWITSYCAAELKRGGVVDIDLENLEAFAKLVAAKEREACEALHEHEDVQAPVGNSLWGEAYQEGWAQGTAAYRAAIRARGEQA